MLISLIVTSIDRRDEIVRLFKSLNEQILFELSNLEIIFIDQGENQDLLEFLDSRIKIDYIHTNRLPLSEARNIGLKHITGEYIGFPDDDCWYHSTLLSDIINIFSKNKGVEAICFRVMDPETNLSYGRRPDAIIRKINYLNIFRYPTSAGLFVKKSDIVYNNLIFNEKFGVGTAYGANEDTEFVHKLLKHNINVYYYGNYAVYHPVKKSFSLIDANKSYNYGIGTGAIIMKLYRENCYFHSFYVCKLFLRSLGAYLYYSLTRNAKSRIYFMRIKGVLKGFQSVKKELI